MAYRSSSSFEKVLRNPEEEVLEGDCNQLVTLYVYLYSLRFPITDLQLKIIPGHVCLHFEGKDLETTKGTWTLYKKFDRIAEIPELISLNLLDIPDEAESREKISPITRLHISRLAYTLSGERSTTKLRLSP